MNFWEFLSIPNKIPYVFPFKWHQSHKNIPILRGSNMCLTFIKFFGASLITNLVPGKVEKENRIKKFGKVRKEKLRT